VHCRLAVVSAAALVATALSAATLTPVARAEKPSAIEPRYAVGLRVLPIEDTSRSTPADPEGVLAPVAAAPTRKLPTSVYYPAVGKAGADVVPDARPAKGRFPVILFSHGAPGTPEDYRQLLERWAAEGYVVVAPTYPVTTTGGPTDAGYADQRDQVRDARFVLDRVLALDRKSVAQGGLGGILDRKHIGAAGHSMGGLTTLALVSACCRDRRIDAAVVLAGVARTEHGPDVSRPAGPILLTHALRDIAVPFQWSQLEYQEASQPKYFLQILLPVGGVLAHMTPFLPGLGPTSAAVARVTDDFLAAYLRGDEGARDDIRPAARSSQYLRLRQQS
jgi:dienelactone hydrolase